MIDLRDAEECDALAAEYVLGLLSADDHRAVATAIGHHVALHAAVYAWQDRLLALSTHAAPIAPRSSLWPRIDIALNVAAPATPRVSPPPASWWQRLPVWQGIAAAALTVVIALSGLLMQVRPDAAASVRYVAVLQSPSDQSVGWVVELTSDRLRLVPTSPSGPVPTGRSLQFWTKPEGAAGPTSLGLVRPGQSAEWPLSQLPGVGSQQLFEITLEPEGGSTIGRPTGPILYVGRTVAL